MPTTAQSESIIELYTAYFNRAADATGFTFWQGSFDTYYAEADSTASDADKESYALQRITDDMSNADEYVALYPSTQTSTEFINSIYTNLLNRDSDADGLAFWVAHIDNGTLTKAQAILQMIAGAKANGTTQGDLDKALIENKTTVSKYFAETLKSDDVDIAKTAFTGLTDDVATVTTANAALDTAVAPTTSEFTLTSDVDSALEGTAITFTITASEAVTADTVVTFNVVPSDTSADDTGTTNSNLADFAAGTFNPTTATILAGETTATFTVTAASDSVTELVETYSVMASVTGSADLSATASILDSVSGGSFVLTTSTDTISGSSNDDTILGDLTTNTINASDQINGGAGTDTFKIFGDFTAGTSATGTITNVETLQIEKVADVDQNFSNFTKASTGIETFILTDASSLTDKSITTSTGQTLSLATGSSNSTTNGTVTWAASATDSALWLALNGYQGGTGVTAKNLTVTGALATTLNIASTGAGNAIATFIDPITVTSHVITGDQALTYALAAANVTNIDANASSGNLNVDISAAMTAATFTFTGGTGDDTIKFMEGNLGALTVGSQLDGGEGTADKLGILDTALSSTELAAINAATNFEVLGLNAGITLVASGLTSIKDFSIDTTGLTQIISDMATGSTVTINAAAPVSLTLGTVTGISDVTIALGTSTSTGNIAVGILETTGITTIALSSNGTGSHTNTITSLTNSDNSSFTVTGTQDLTISLSAGTAVGSSIVASALTGKLMATGSGFNDILTGGTGDDTLVGGDGLQAGDGVDTFTGNAGSDVFNALSSTELDLTSGAVTDTITDFTTSADTIGGQGTAGSSTNYTEVSAAAADLSALLGLADIALDGTIKYYVGVVGSDSYLVADIGADIGYTDVVKLTGIGVDGITFSDIIM